MVFKFPELAVSYMFEVYCESVLMKVSQLECPFRELTAKFTFAINDQFGIRNIDLEVREDTEGNVAKFLGEFPKPHSPVSPGEIMNLICEVKSTSGTIRHLKIFEDVRLNTWELDAFSCNTAEAISNKINLSFKKMRIEAP